MKKFNDVFVMFLMMVMVLFSNTGVQAEEGRFAISPRLSTLGIGGEGVLRMSDSVNARVGINAFKYDYDGTEDGVDYNFELGLLNFSAILDWFPLDSDFRVSGGLIVNQNEIDMKAKSSAATFDIGDTTYTSTELGTLTGNIGFNDVAPYVGIGWGSPFSSGSNWSISVDMGVMFQGSPEVDLSADGLLATNATFISELDKEKGNLESELENYQFYPVLSLGVVYRF